MRARFRKAALAISFALMVACAFWHPGGQQLVPADQGQATDSDATFQREILPAIETHCASCHEGATAEAGLDVTEFSKPEQFLFERRTWLKAIAKLRSGEMPPPADSELPTALRKKMISWLDHAVNDIECGGPPRPGRVTLRRLNRREYRNTIRDLIGVDYEPAEDFPADDVGYGFDNIGDVLSLPPILMEKYLRAAEEITEKAIAAGIHEHPIADVPGHKFSGAGRGLNPSSRILTTNGTAWTEIDFPYPGKYRLQISVSGDQAGGEWIEMGVELGRARVQTIQVKNSSPSKEYPYLLTVQRKGVQRVGISFLNDYYDPQARKPGERDRNLIIDQLRLTGPINVRNEHLPASHRAIFVARPDPDTSESSAARQVLVTFASRAFRRPITDDEANRFVKLYRKLRIDQTSFEATIGLCLQAVLVSPHFLFRVEDNETKEPRQLSEHELAVRLSYFLWSSLPDKRLRDLADRGQLRSSLNSEVLRMLQDPKAIAFVENFGLQWLQLRTLDEVTPDTSRFPQFNDQLKQDMLTETRMFLAHIVRENRRVQELVTADYTFVNDRLAKHYGMRPVGGKEFRQTSLANLPRRGLLGHASILTVTSNPTRTSPVKRGKWVLDNLLGEPPPPPAPDAPMLDEQELTGTLREQMEQHRSNPSCAACHRRMDPLGFALQKFDAVGRFRDQERGKEIDTSGELPTGEKINGLTGLAQLLTTTKRDEFLRCFVERLLTYALGRGLEYYDQCAVNEIMQAIDKQDDRIATVILAVALSEPFQWLGVNQGR